MSSVVPPPDYWLYASAGAAAGLTARAHKWVDPITKKFSWKLFGIDLSSAILMIMLGVAISEVFQMSAGFAAATTGFIVWFGSEVLMMKMNDFVDQAITAVVDRIRGSASSAPSASATSVTNNEELSDVTKDTRVD